MSAITIKRKVLRRRPDRQSIILRSFRGITRSYFTSEKYWELAAEFVLFAMLAVISVWPILAAARALTDFLQQTNAIN